MAAAPPAGGDAARPSAHQQAGSSSGGSSGTGAAPSAPSAAWLPEPNAKNALLAVGSACLLGMVHFYRRKQTAPFKACWALMWPTLGGGVMLAVQPDEAELAKLVPPEELAKRREANEAIRRLAAGAVRGGGEGGRPAG